MAALVTDYDVLASAWGVVDRSQRGKLALAGAEAKAALQGLVTQDVEALTPGSGALAAVLTNKGKMLGDVRVLDTGTELHLDCERIALQEVFNVLRRGTVGYDAELHKRTIQEAQFALIGPWVPAALRPGAVEHDAAQTVIAGQPVLVVRTDCGADLFFAAEAAPAVRAALEAPDCDDSAAEILRVESGRPRYGVDIDDTVIPQEAGLNGRAVSFTKGCYIGQETVARLFYRGKPTRHLRGLALSEALPSGTMLRNGERELGRLGSSVVSPRLGPIALALIRREAEPGDIVAAGDDGASATVVALPFT